ncbi:MAG: hypothetical protein ACOYK8_03505 [Alphaproteobacteria bacterium]
MANSAQHIFRQLIDSKALQTRDHAADRLFWYTANLPGPFYINVEKLVGDNVDDVLEAINSVLKTPHSVAEKTAAIAQLLEKQMASTPSYQQLIEHLYHFAEPLLAKADFISGGERRDWLFSWPLALRAHKAHLFLFKDGHSHWLNGTPPAHGSVALHVADLINNAVSYHERWLPFLTQAGYALPSTLAVVVRGQKGLQSLQDIGMNVCFPVHLDMGFMQQAATQGLISPFAAQQAGLYLQDPLAWALETLPQLPLNNWTDNSPKEQERLKLFLTQDQWQLAEKLPDLWKKLTNTILGTP